jgi:hypothetical protein
MARCVSRQPHDWEKADEPPAQVPPSTPEPTAAEDRPVLLRGVAGVVAVILAARAVASVVTVFVDSSANFASVRERAASGLLFAAVIPMLMLWGAARLALSDPPIDRPPNYGKGRRAIDVAISLPLILISILTFLSCILSAVEFLTVLLTGA